MHSVRAAFLVLLAAVPAASQTIDELVALKRVSGTPAITADGRWVAFAVRETNWTDNAYETEIWLADARGGAARQLTADTSPMTYITQAKTPTLIQHGDRDQRVPIPNAFELYQGLQDQKVPVELMIFRGFGHGLDKPKANRAAMERNWEWFGKYLWPGETSTQARGQ